MNVKYKNGQVVFSNNQVIGLFGSMVITLVVFIIALMSDIGWFWAVLVSQGVLFWSKMFWATIEYIVNIK